MKPGVLAVGWGLWLLLVGGCVDPPGEPSGACRDPDHACPSGYRCSGAACLRLAVQRAPRLCAEASDCDKAALLRCKIAAGDRLGLCVACLADSDCLAGEVCGPNAQCFPCIRDDDCESGLCIGFGCASCDSTGIACHPGASCVAGRCENCGDNSDCLSGWCDAGVCRSKAARAEIEDGGEP